jgi:hypothetical protein
MSVLVVLSARQASLLLQLCAPTLGAWERSGRPIPSELRHVLAELATAAKHVTDVTRFDDVSTQRFDTLRAGSIDLVTTKHAAQQLHVTQQAVTARLRRGTLAGIQMSDGTWRVDARQLPPLASHGDSEVEREHMATPRPSGVAPAPTSTARKETT